jgi:tRNA pseudouridine55 synthase
MNDPAGRPCNDPASKPERPPRRALDGLVLVDKPPGITSNATLMRVKRAFRADKAGHTGTLDPLATGLLPVCFGEATKFSAALLDADKGYRATIELGVTTDTGDREGVVIATGDPPSDQAVIERVLDAFRGPIEQRPHRYSALKRGGKALYKDAREGVDIEIEPRAVRILRLDVESWKPPLLAIDVLCSKGTYIRSLAEDIGVRLGCGAHVAELRRTQVGHLRLAEGMSLERIESMASEERDALIQPVVRLVEKLGSVELDDVAATGFLNGRRIELGRPEITGVDAGAGAAIAVLLRGHAGDDGFLGLATIARGPDGASTILVPQRVVATQWARRTTPEAS